MAYLAPTQTNDTIRQNADFRFALENAPGAQARRDADTAEYKRKRRLKAIKRYLLERAAR